MSLQPQELVPVHPVYGVQDWDRAEGAIEWPRMVKALEEVSKLISGSRWRVLMLF